MTPRCALVELNECHGETLATFVRLAEEAGFHVDVFMRRRVAEMDPFPEGTRVPDAVHVLERLETRIRRRALGFRGYELVVANSVEPVAALDALGAVRRPMAGVVHNGVVLERDARFTRFFAEERRAPVALGRHVATSISSGEAPWIAPVELGPPGDASVVPDRFVVQGSVDLARRDYLGLVEALEQLGEEESSSFRVELVGGAHGVDGLRLARRMDRSPAGARIDWEDRRVDYDSFLRRIAAAGFILPLVEPRQATMRAYFEDKITSSVSMAIGLARIPVLHHRLAALYGLGEIGVTHGDGALADGMRAALALTQAERRRRVEALLALRESLLERSSQVFSALVERVLPGR